MTSQYSHSNNTKPLNNNPWVTYYYNDSQMEGCSVIDFTNNMVPSENFVSPYPSCSADRQPYLFPEINLFEAGYPTNLEPNFSVNHNQSTLRNTQNEMFSNLAVQEVDSSCGSPTFEMKAHSPSSSDFMQKNYRFLPSPSPSNETSNAPVDCSLRNPSSKKGPIKKHKRRHIMNRSKLGCWICRIKHLKCDEVKPTCTNCLRFGIQCDYSQKRPAYVSDRRLRRQKLDAIITKKRRRPINDVAVMEDNELPLTNSDQSDYPHFSKHDWMAFLGGQSVT